MRFLKSVGLLFYGLIASYLLWLLFYWLTPYVMSVGWGGFILYMLIAGGLVTGIVGSAATLLAYPVAIWFDGAYKPIKWICAVFFVFHGFSAIMLPWRLDIDYSFLKILIAVLYGITALISFGAFLAVFVKGSGEEK